MPTNDFVLVWGRAEASGPSAHLVAHGADVTLCNRPATGLPAVDETSRPDAHGSLCWVCRATAQV